MAAQGYDMTGVDNSMEMLQIAMEKSGDVPILYLLQSMQELELDGSVRAVYSACDCVNYILDGDQLRETFCRVYRYLEPGGIFVFDINTDYKYRQLLGDCTFAESRDEGSFIWENYYDEKERINEYDLTLFVPEGQGLYRRYLETHYQKNYEIGQVEALLSQTGLTCLGIYDDYTKRPVGPKCERATFVVQKESI
jgi:SAM-dependent methyltransferase